MALEDAPLPDGLLWIADSAEAIHSRASTTALIV
jgi:hypothetical protein